MDEPEVVLSDIRDLLKELPEKMAERSLSAPDKLGGSVPSLPQSMSPSSSPNLPRLLGERRAHVPEGKFQWSAPEMPRTLPTSGQVPLPVAKGPEKALIPDVPKPSSVFGPGTVPGGTVNATHRDSGGHAGTAPLDMTGIEGKLDDVISALKELKGVIEANKERTNGVNEPTTINQYFKAQREKKKKSSGFGEMSWGWLQNIMGG